MYQYLNGNKIYATVSAVTVDTFFNTIVDTVKTYSFFSSDTSFHYDTCQLLLGQNLGLIETFAFYYFPYPMPIVYSYGYDIEYFQYVLQLEGMTTPDVGINKLTYQELYDFNVGDFFEKGPYDYQLNTRNPKTQLRILSKTIVQDTVIYTAARYSKYIQIVAPYTPPNTIITNDTITLKYRYTQDYFLDSIPNSIVGGGGGTHMHKEVCGHYSYVTYSVRSYYLYFFDTAACNYPTFEISQNSVTYATGLGKFAYADMNPDYGYWTSMYAFQKVGYKMCGQSLLSVSDVSQQVYDIVVYPNPVHDQLTVELPSNHPVQISVIDVSGKVLREYRKNNLSTLQINMQDMAKGVYFIEVYQDDVRYFKRVIVY